MSDLFDNYDRDFHDLVDDIKDKIDRIRKTTGSKFAVQNIFSREILFLKSTSVLIFDQVHVPAKCLHAKGIFKMPWKWFVFLSVALYLKSS